MAPSGDSAPGPRELAAAAAFSLAFLAFFQFQTPYLPDTDAHFHMKAAWLMRHHGLFHGFPWAAFSFWKDGYSDTCLLFHLYLIPFTFLPDLAFAGKLATVLLAAACFTSFYAVLRLNGVRQAWPWLGVLCISGPCFLWRINVPRPQLLSVLLMLWFIHFLLNERWRAVYAVCFLYPYAYAAAFLPLVFVALRGAHLAVWEHRLDWKTPARACGAVLAGLVLHPYFPRDLMMLYVQNFYVMGVNLFLHEKLHMGDELNPMDTRNMLASHIPLLCAWAGVSQLGAALGRKAASKTRLMGEAALVAVLMAFVSERFIEYAAPMLLLACALRLSELLEGGEAESYLLRYPARRRAAAALLVLFFLIGGSASTWATVRAFRAPIDTPLKGEALWLKAHAAQGEVVFTCDWGDAPQLFFYDDAQRYLVFLDPVFMYYRDAELWRTWRDTAEARLGPDTYKTLQGTFRVRYGVCERRFRDLRALIADDGRFEVPYEDTFGYVFRLKEAP